MFAAFTLRHLKLHASRHVTLFLLFSLQLFLLTATLLLSESIRHAHLQSLDNAPDITIQRFEAGRQTPIPSEWSWKLREIAGVQEVRERVYGYYDFEIAGQTLTIMGVDSFLPGADERVDKLLADLDWKAFYATPSMLLGKGVLEALQGYHYDDSFRFILSDGTIKTVRIFGTFPASLSTQAHSLMLMPLPLAREILDIPENRATDLAMQIPNSNETPLIAQKIRQIYPDARVLTRDYLESLYQRLFDYKSGLFLVLFLTIPASFLLLLWYKTSALTRHEKQEIATMRAVGWSITDVMKLKIAESLLIALSGFVVGFCGAYGFVFGLDAPLLQAIFLGSDDLPPPGGFTPHIEPILPISLFFISVLPYIAATIYPAWRAAITDIGEVLR